MHEILRAIILLACALSTPPALPPTRNETKGEVGRTCPSAERLQATIRQALESGTKDGQHFRPTMRNLRRHEEKAQNTEP